MEGTLRFIANISFLQIDPPTESEALQHETSKNQQMEVKQQKPSNRFNSFAKATATSIRINRTQHNATHVYPILTQRPTQATCESKRTVETQETAPDRNQKLEIHLILEKALSSPQLSPAFSPTFSSKLVELTIKMKMGMRRFCFWSFISRNGTLKCRCSRGHFEVQLSSCCTHLGFRMHSVCNQTSPQAHNDGEPIFHLARSDFLFLF